MAVACAKLVTPLPNIVISGRSGSPPKIELFVTIIYSWNHSTNVSKSSFLGDSRRLAGYDFTITVETDSVMKSFWIELDGFFVKQKLIY